MRILASHLRALWADESGISSVEYAMLLAFVAAGIVEAADMLSNAVSNEFLDTVFVLDGGCGNSGGGDGVGSGNGQGGANTC